RGLKTLGARGDLSMHDAVMVLLKGTKLEVRTDLSGAMLIVAPAQGKRDVSSKSPLDSDSAKEGKRDSSGQFLLAQATSGPTQADASVDNQDKSAPKRVIHLEEVVVTGSRIPELKDQQIQPVSSYSREEIAESGQTTIANFLNTLPDVSVGS